MALSSDRDSTRLPPVPALLRGAGRAPASPTLLLCGALRAAPRSVLESVPKSGGFVTLGWRTPGAGAMWEEISPRKSPQLRPALPGTAAETAKLPHARAASRYGCSCCSAPAPGPAALAVEAEEPGGAQPFCSPRARLPLPAVSCSCRRASGRRGGRPCGR